MKPLIVANWKMNPATLAEAKRLFNSIKSGLKDIKNVEVIVCPPFVYLPVLKPKTRGPSSAISFGGQSCFWEEKGAFTGEVSPKMLKDLGCDYVILGHSERRRYLNETDEMVNKKLKAVLKSGLKPILCIGSKERGELGNIEMESQLQKALSGIKKSELKDIIITYEPVWAISTTKDSVIATPENTKEGKIFVRDNLIKLFDKSSAPKVRIIYGGSVNNANIEGFIKTAKMEGVLIGAASLDSEEFIKLAKNAARA